MWLCVLALALITAVNLYGVAESAKVMIMPTVVFIVAIFTVIFVGLVRSHPVTEPTHPAASAAASVGVLLLLKAFASGCSALTGVEAIANAVPTFRKPRVRRAQRTEVALGALLGVMLISLSVSIGDEVRAVTVTHPEEQDEAALARLHEDWAAWQPHVPLAVLSCDTRSLTRPIVDYLHEVELTCGHDRLIVLIPEMQLSRPLLRLLQNQRGSVLDRAIRRHTDVVICRLRFRVKTA